jgi:hypothetical protein
MNFRLRNVKLISFQFYHRNTPPNQTQTFERLNFSQHFAQIKFRLLCSYISRPFTCHGPLHITALYISRPFSINATEFAQREVAIFWGKKKIKKKKKKLNRTNTKETLLFYSLSSGEFTFNFFSKHTLNVPNTEHTLLQLS